MDWCAPGGHRYELRTAGMRLTTLPGFGSVLVAVRGEPERLLGPDEDDQRFKPGFWKQDSVFLRAAREKVQPEAPAASLADAHRSMVLIDRICGGNPAQP
jgi:hypothetical protein